MQHKTVVIGDSGVGKSSLIRYLYTGKFDLTVEPTIAAAFCLYRHVNTQTCFHIWDTAGQERFLSFVPMYLRNARIALLVYDVSRPETLDRLIRQWYPYSTQYVDPDTIYVLIENKIDLATDQTAETTKRAKEFVAAVTDRQIRFVQASARLGVGIHSLFDQLAHELKDSKTVWPTSSGIIQLDRDRDSEMPWTKKMLSWFKCEH